MIIVYFHGYGSSPKSDKVEALKKIPGAKVHAFYANINPDISITEVSNCIDMVLLEDFLVEEPIVFVGTSLGAWMASKLGNMYGVDTILINPSMTPSKSLLKYGVPKEICEKYTDIIPSKNTVFFFAENDEVIDNKSYIGKLINDEYEVIIDKLATHRFNGESFEQVVKFIDKKYRGCNE